MADIFISYASGDRSKVEPLAKALEDHGWSVWWDRDLPYGLPFDELIRTELRAAGCVVALWTESAAASLYVIGEARDALRFKKLISVFPSLSRAELPYDLQAIHGVELIDWHGDTSSADYQRLLGGITAIVGRPPQQKAKTETGHQAEKETKKKADAEATRKADEEEQRAEAGRKAEEERKKKNEAKRKIEEECKRKEDELKRLEAARKAEEESKQKDDSPKHATKDPITTAAAKDEGKLAEPQPFEQTSGIKKPVEKSPFIKIGILIASFVVIVVGAILLFRQEPTTSITEISAPPVKQEQQVATKTSETSPLKKFSNSIGMKFVRIPAGKFVMGSPPNEPGRYNDERQHEVNISKPFYMQTTEVSQVQWKRVMENNPSNFNNCGDDCPVEQVSWVDAQKFIDKLNKMEGINKYRLPTEAEWEYACRAKTETVYSFGDEVDQLGEYAWFKDNSMSQTNPVGIKKPNAWRLYDMHGNVWEWCQDWYGDYPSSQISDPKGPYKGEKRVLRGGSWYDPAERLRSAHRISYSPGTPYSGIGFRVARDF